MKSYYYYHSTIFSRKGKSILIEAQHRCPGLLGGSEYVSEHLVEDERRAFLVASATPSLVYSTIVYYSLSMHFLD